MSKSLLFFFVLVLFFQIASSQAPGSGSTIPFNEDEGEKIDLSPKISFSDTALHISNRAISYDSVLAWKQDKKFGYLKQLDSFLKKENKEQLNHGGGASKKGNQKGDRFGADAYNEGIFRLSPVAGYFLWGIAALFVFWILYNIFISKGKFARKKLEGKVKWVEGEMAVEDSVVVPGGYPKLISDAVSYNNFRLAIRYQFLFLLQKLELQGALHISKEKTNSSYIEEINPQYRELFSGLVHIYEHAWYGHTRVSASRYHEIARLFDQFIP